MNDSRPLPPTLFKYQPFNVRTLENLKSRTLWFSSPSRFNDPFDCALSVLANIEPERELQQVFENIRRNSDPSDAAYLDQCLNPDGTVKQSLLEALRIVLESTAETHVRPGQRGIACLAESPTDLLMWAHYADGHRGFCLEFDTLAKPFNGALRVEYMDDFPAVNAVGIADGLSFLDAAANQLLRAMLLTKASCWGYEKEWRVLHTAGDHAYTYHWSALRGVHCGAAMPDTHLEIIAMVLAGSPTRLFKVHRHDQSFSVETQPISYQPYQYKTGEE